MRFKTVEILMVGDSTVKRTVSYTQKKSGFSRNRFFQTYASTWSCPPDPRQVVPEGSQLRQRNLSVVERLRLLSVKFAEISLNVNPLDEHPLAA